MGTLKEDKISRAPGGSTDAFGGAGALDQDPLSERKN
jgi:hypothetical protein